MLYKQKKLKFKKGLNEVWKNQIIHKFNTHTIQFLVQKKRREMATPFLACLMLKRNNNLSRFMHLPIQLNRTLSSCHFSISMTLNKANNVVYRHRQQTYFVTWKGLIILILKLIENVIFLDYDTINIS